MPQTDLQLGGGYIYQWECALLLALEYLLDIPLEFSVELHQLIERFLGQVESIHLEGETREQEEVELEDINLFGNNGTICIQVKTKEAEGKWWIPSDRLLKKAIYHFYCNQTWERDESPVQFVFLSNRGFNPDLVKVKDAIDTGVLAQSEYAEHLFNQVQKYAKSQKAPSLNKSRFYQLLSRLSFVEFLQVDAVEAAIKARLQFLGIEGWAQAYNHFYTLFSKASVRTGGTQITRTTLVNSLDRFSAELLQLRVPPIALHQLPPNITDFTGRGNELTEMIAALEADGQTEGTAVVIYGVAGMPGVGKSVLAIHVAHCLKEHFSDAQLYVDLRGTEGQPMDPFDVLGGFLRALGVEDQHIPDAQEERARFYRSRITDKRALVLLDNARDEAQVRPLLPGNPTCAVLITSRRRFSALAGATIVTLKKMPKDEALQLLERLVGENRVRSEIESARQIITFCGQLPLAIRIAGGKLKDKRHWELEEYADQLSNERQRLTSLQLGDLDVRASFTLSYRDLDPGDARLFRLLGGLLSEPSFALEAAAALSDTEQITAWNALERLEDLQLLEPVDRRRYRFHDLIRLFAQELFNQEESTDKQEAARSRAYRWYLTSPEVHFYKKAMLLDKALLWRNIIEYPQTTKVILESLSADASLERYFFRHLAASENPAWFEFLKQHGIFDTPPEPIEIEGKISYPQWPALQYLVAIAPKRPEGVVEIAKQIETQDMVIKMKLVQAAQAMSSMYAAQMAPSIVRWADEGMPIEDSVISLAIHLAQENQWDAALALVGSILSPQEQPVSEEMESNPFFSPRVISKAESYYVKTFVEQGIDLFIERRPIAMLQVVQENLQQVIAIEGKDRDFSTVWRRPAIEPHEQNFDFGEIKHLLIDVAVKTLRSVVENVPDQAKTTLREYLEHRHSIFQRLAIHTIRTNKALWPDLLESLFTDERYLMDTKVYHEYWTLMHDTFGHLPAPAQSNFIKLLLDILSQRLAEKEIDYHGTRGWILRWLLAIEDFLSDRHLAIQKGLIEEYGKPDHPSFLSFSRPITSWAGPELPEGFSELSPAEIIAELRKELPFHDFGEPSQEGLADVLKSAVVSDSEHFASFAPQLFGPDIPPIYTDHMIWGFQESWKENKAFDWRPVLELCHAVSETGREAGDNGEPADMRPGYWKMTYAGARSAVANLINTGIARDDNAIPSKYLGQARDILLVLADDPNPSPEYEQKWSVDHPTGILGLALNVIRGRAVETLIQYSLHVARINAKAESGNGNSTSPESKLEDIVKNKLTEKLNKQIDPSLAVHCLFGKYLPNLYYLDKGWVITNLESIFPRQEDMSDYWEVAWDGYLFRSDFFGYLYDILKPYYRYALEQLALGEQGKAGSTPSHGRLAKHLAVVYWHGLEPLEGNDSLIRLFFNSAPDDVRAKFISSFGIGLRDIKPGIDSDEWLHARVLWTTRFQAVKAVIDKEGQPTGFIEELAAFTTWMPFIPEDLENFYAMIEQSALIADDPTVFRLVEFLSSVVDDHARFVVSLLEKFLQQGRRPWFLATKDDIVRAILETAMHSGDDEAKSCAVRIINLLGERGDERYRDILKAA